MSSEVILTRVARYDADEIEAALDDSLFAQIQPGDRVVLKPNWVMEAHKFRKDEWEHVITHPALITAVIHKVCRRLNGAGSIAVLDGPTTEASFKRLIARYPVEAWYRIARHAGVSLEVIDLRDWEWETSNEVIVKRHRLPGDPRGSTEADLVDEASEFHGHRRSARGYFGADYDRTETNRAHDGHHNRYRVSRTVMEADVFINLPKLKTHRKAGITACLKNLVGINTYKNFLPHHTEGGLAEGGDQFPDPTRARLEGPLLALIKQHVLRRTLVARVLSPLRGVGRRVFGASEDVVRSGNWYGNDTIWRMILDLNKILVFGRPDGTLVEPTERPAKRFIGIVDAIVGGQGNGPLAPDPVRFGCVLAGTNAVAIDTACAALMGFDPRRIPAIARAYQIRSFPLCDFAMSEVHVRVGANRHRYDELPAELQIACEPHFGWKGHIEKTADVAAA